MTRKGDATIEFLKNKNAIEKRLEELYFIKNTYIEFKEKGLINFKYDQFRVLCNKFILNKQKEKPINKHPSVQPQRSTPNTKAAKTAPQQTVTKPTHSTTDEKPRDPYRRKTKPIHNPTMTPERRKELFG
ncbi:hypothetical protein QNZ87_004214 [Vibrio parahaemolyticus]|nr:hypothetical protein [Vibrio parahaemolyticus]